MNVETDVVDKVARFGVPEHASQAVAQSRDTADASQGDRYFFLSTLSTFIGAVSDHRTYPDAPHGSSPA
jgi:hypothetical protein